SDSLENAADELARFFKPGEIFDYESSNLNFLYAVDEQ
ncbi:MAG: nucleoside-diphosphate kinase, partial [Paraprevotella sp.]|nr:nucleoside-diphosphate kinase [Paraprevotella sp.]